VVGCITDGQESEYRDLVAGFVERSGRNHLLLNVAKTKEMVVDFRGKKTALKRVIISDEEVEVR